MAPLSSDARGRGRGMGSNGGGGGQQASLPAVISTMPMQDLSDEEKSGLLKMREEEKLARDVYQQLYKKWNHLTFAQIAKSEQQHMDILEVLLTKYSLPDPAAGREPGVFTDQKLQKLYDNLVAKGEKSVLDALQVGATVEDLDISDLNGLIKETDNHDIKTVYQNMVKGSRNHLRAFSGRLGLKNVSYEAQFLAAADIEAIINSPLERGMVDENGTQIRGGSGSGKGQRRAGMRGGNNNLMNM